MSLRFRFLSVPAFAVVVLLSGCDEDTCIECPDTRVLSPAQALTELRTAWITRDSQSYASLLADDFRFYIDPETRLSHSLPEYWDRAADSTYTALLFESDDISAIRLPVLDFNPVPEDVNEVGRLDWKMITVTDEKLEVDLKPQPGEDEGTTLLVEGQPHKFYFRKGRSPADTLASSPTAEQYFITEWRDLGRPLDARARGQASRSTSWSSIKVLYAL